MERITFILVKVYHYLQKLCMKFEGKLFFCREKLYPRGKLNRWHFNVIIFIATFPDLLEFAEFIIWNVVYFQGILMQIGFN